ncbi:hypothetical protein F25303_13005, partial [Fusarium sp. NRRL 25303]
MVTKQGRISVLGLENTLPRQFVHEWRDGSTVSIFPLNSPGNFGHVANVFHYNLKHPGPGTGDSQEIANPHAAIFSPCGNIMAVPDRGADRTGPRHIVFSQVSKEKTIMFLVSELDNTVNVFLLENGTVGYYGKHPDLNETLSITHLQRASTLDDSSKRTKPNNVDLASEISVSHDRRFLYVSNRNTESVHKADTLALYSLDIYSKKPLKFLGLNSTYVANQVTNDLFILKRDFKTGFLDDIVGKYSFGKLDLTTKVGP